MKSIVLLLLSIALCIGQPPTLSGYDYFMDLTSTMVDGTLSPTGTYFALYYKVRLPNVTIGVVGDAPANGWIGFGWSNNGDMVTSDAILGYVDTTNTGFITDFYLTARNAPTPSVCAGGGGSCPDVLPSGRPCQNNFDNGRIQRIGNYLTLEFTRPVAASDGCDIAVTPGVSQYVVYAVGFTGGAAAWPFRVQFHSARTLTPYNLTLNTAIPTTAVPTTAVPTTALPVATTAAATTGQASTAVASTGIPTTAVATTSVATTGAPINPPVLTGYARSVDLTGTLSDGVEPVSDYFMLYYSVVPPNISIGIVAQVDRGGWIGFGLSPSGYMVLGNTSSDAVIAYLDSQNALQVTDFELTDKRAPDPVICTNGGPGVCPDNSRTTKNCADNVFGRSATRSGNYLAIEFTRPLVASDACDVAVTVNQPQNIIYATGPITNIGTWPYKVQFHSARSNGTRTVTWAPPVTTGAPTTASTCSIGSERCACTVGKGCNPGLVCRSDICVVGTSTGSQVIVGFAVILLVFLVL